MASNANTAGLTEGPKGTVALKGQVGPGGAESVSSSDTGVARTLTTPGGPTMIVAKGGDVMPGAFAKPGGSEKI